MRLQTKLTLASAGVISALGLILGGVAVAANEAAGVGSLDKVIEASQATIVSEPTDKISAAMLVASEAGDALEVGYIDPSGLLTNLGFSPDVIHAKPTETQLKKAALEIITVKHSTASYRLHTVKLADGDWIVLAMSLADVESARASGVAAIGGTTLAAVFLGGLVIGLITRRETKKIYRLTAEAERIAGGDLEHDLTAEAGSSEVDRLSRALESMVESLQQSVRVERAAQSRMQEFLGDASHELRTPLTVVRGYLEMISGGELPADARERALERMNSEIRRMELLIKDLLQVAELSEATSSVAMVDEIDLGRQLSNAVEDLRVLSPARAISVSVEPGLVILGRADLIAQLLANVFGNISRHTAPEDAVQVTLSSDDSGYALLDIEDAGPGLPAEAYERGAEAFKRFDPSRSREHGGSGLGMSIIQGIVKTLGGQIELSKSELGGLRTRIRLPLVVVRESTSERGNNHAE